MEKNSLSKFLEKIMKNKKVAPLIIALLVLLLIYFSLSYFINVNNISKNKNTNPNNQATVVDAQGEEITKEEYERVQTKELEEILGKINGVGKVTVKLTFDGSEEKIPAVDKNTQTNNVEESDNSGGKKFTKQETGGEKVVVTSGSKGDEPLILKTEKPKVIGVMIVAEGAKEQKIKYEITKAVASLYDISLEKVNVLPMDMN